MELIGREELKAKLDRGDDFRLVMCLGKFAFTAKHIPGSINLSNPKIAHEVLDPDDEIVVYCSDEACVASKYAYFQLTRHGYEKVRPYAGGIADWEETGYPLKGEWVR